MRKCALCPHDLRAALIRFQRCLGEWSRFGAINKANRLTRMRGVYAALPEIASEKKIRAIGNRPANARNSSPLMRSTCHPRLFWMNIFRKILFVLRGLTLPGYFNSARRSFPYFKPCAPVKPPRIREETSNDKPDVRRQSSEKRNVRTPEGDASGLRCRWQEASPGISHRHP